MFSENVKMYRFLYKAQQQQATLPNSKVNLSQSHV